MIEIIENFLKENWHKQKEILSELSLRGFNINSRQWRKEVERHNKNFKNHITDFYITHSNRKGYKATTNYSEAQEGRNDYISRAIDMLQKAKDCDEGFKTKDNLRIDFEGKRII